VLSSAIGHLLEICPPEGFEAPRGRWTFTHLPVIPPEFALRPIERSEARLRLLEKLIKRKDMDALINACDAGREANSSSVTLFSTATPGSRSSACGCNP